MTTVLILTRIGSDDAARESSVGAGGYRRELPLGPLGDRFLEVECNLVVLLQEAAQPPDNVGVNEQVVGVLGQRLRDPLSVLVDETDLGPREGDLVQTPRQLQLVEDDDVLAVPVARQAGVEDVPLHGSIGGLLPRLLRADLALVGLFDADAVGVFLLEVHIAVGVSADVVEHETGDKRELLRLKIEFGAVGRIGAEPGGRLGERHSAQDKDQEHGCDGVLSANACHDASTSSGVSQGPRIIACRSSCPLRPAFGRRERRSARAPRRRGR